MRWNDVHIPTFLQSICCQYTTNLLMFISRFSDDQNRFIRGSVSRCFHKCLILTYIFLLIDVIESLRDVIEMVVFRENEVFRYSSMNWI